MTDERAHGPARDLTHVPPRDRTHALTHDADAIVVGGGVAGLNAAHRLAAHGVRPLVVEARGQVGGLVFGRKVGDGWVDLGAESYAKRSRYVTALCAELGLVTVDPAAGSWIVDPDREVSYPIPHGVLGIPASLDDPAVAAALSPAGLARARADLTMGPDAGADAADLATLVETRLGREVLDALVAPVAGGIHSASPHLLAPDAVAPGLVARLRATGSLVAAAAEQRAAAPAGAVVSAVEGGMFLLADALRDRIERLGGDVATEQLVTAVRPWAGGWQVDVAARRRPADPWLPGLPDGEPTTLTTPLLVVALDGREALDLLRPLPELGIGDWRLPDGADLVQVTIALDDPRLDAAPRGSGCLVVAPAPTPVPSSSAAASATATATATVRAKALTHYSAKWPWARRASGQHVLRVSYGRAGVPTPEPTTGEALRDASTLLGLELDPLSVRGATTIHFANALPPHTPEHRARVAQLQRDVEQLPGLGVTGAWVAGSGLAGTLPHAEATARRLLP